MHDISSPDQEGRTEAGLVSQLFEEATSLQTAEVLGKFWTPASAFQVELILRVRLKTV
jgi:hypothetical protein